MNHDQAATLIGVAPTTNHAEARKAYLSRARLLHPDRFAGGSSEETAAATAAMAQLNQAWEVFQAGPQASPRQPDAPPDPMSHLPKYSGTDVCDICGWGPATHVKFHSVTGMILFWRWGTFEANVCRLCGQAMYHENQRSTLTRGWWGIIAPLATIVAFIGNMSQVSKVKALPLPQGRNPYAQALFPTPIAWFKPWFKRPLALICTAIALYVIGSIAAGLMQPSRPSPAVPSNPSSGSSNSTPVTSDSGVGVCFAESSGGQLLEVNCSDGSAVYVGSRNVPSPDMCAGYTSDGSYLQWAKNEYLCLATS